MNTITTYGDFGRYLEKIGELHRVKVAVDPCLEITEIARRAIRLGKPAILFENVRGSAFPVIVNALASDRRCELALHKHPQQLGNELVDFFGDLLPPRPSTVFAHRALAWRFLAAPVRIVSGGRAQEVVEMPNLDSLPVLTCWPDDGGRFVTLPQVVTYDPVTRKRNMGIYRMHVFDRETTGMHWQIQKGGGFHFSRAEKIGQPLELAVALGTDPALLLATVAALPENIDEAMFAGFLRGKRTQFTRGRSIGIDVPAHAEFVLEGVVRPGERRREGPFGDHFGHYSDAADFPVFHVTAMTHRKDPVYPATVVGIPPMEDKFLGDATQEILGPLVRVIHPEITAMWAYYEAGFHNLLVVAVDQRYAKEAMKTALGLMGLSQLALTKCIVLVSEGVNVRSFDDVLKEIEGHFDPHFDFVLIPRVPLDTLDFTSLTMNLGSRMILDATRKPRGGDHRRERRVGQAGAGWVEHVKRSDRRIKDVRLLHHALLVVRVAGSGKDVLKKILKRKEVENIAIVATVSEDVDMYDRENLIWGIFTRFDCARDIQFSAQEMIGASPVYRGVMGIDATWKKGYPPPLTMSDDIIRKVDERWELYWK